MLYITQDFIFDQTIKNTPAETLIYGEYPSVYIIYCKTTKKAYIGETTNILSRLGQHLTNQEKKKLKNVKVILSPFFNKSAVLDIESSLIQHMLADNQFKLLNGNDGILNHYYYQKPEYEQMFKDIWKNLKFEKLVKNDLLNLQNSDLFKYSPYKSLSEDQYHAIKRYLSILDEQDAIPTLIQGSAGTGKTILAVYLVKLLLSDIGSDDLEGNFTERPLIELAQKVKLKLKGDKDEVKVALVVPMTSLRKTLKKVFKSIHGLSPKMVIGPNEVKSDYYDLLIVDEAHRLKRRKNITGYAEFDKTNRHFGLGKDGTELDWIMRSSKYQLFFYDANQSIRPTDIEKEKFEQLKNISVVMNLQSQMRAQGGDDYIKFVDSLLNNRDVQPWQSANYELRLFDDMAHMVRELEQKEQGYGLCRLISGYSWDWVSKKDSGRPDVTLDGVDLYWNRTNADWINSTQEMTEMGCIHTTQGYDLNYAGVIFGSDIVYNSETQKIEIRKENYFDRNGKAGISDEHLHNYIINIYKTIMYRGIKGTYVYCCDENLREYFREYMDVSIF
ncbi:MAG: DUF2075 domain-containing protein [Alcaligenaceae bacterium]|nr:DUF2075 domain-containing protein [Alcaligenaceae bacterium]